MGVHLQVAQLRCSIEQAHVRSPRTLTPDQTGQLQDPRVSEAKLLTHSFSFRANASKRITGSKKKTLRLDKETEMKIQMQSRVKKAKMARETTSKGKGMITTFYDKIGVGSHHREKKVRSYESKRTSHVIRGGL